MRRVVLTVSIGTVLAVAVVALGLSHRPSSDPSLSALRPVAAPAGGDPTVAFSAFRRPAAPIPDGERTALGAVAEQGNVDLARARAFRVDGSVRAAWLIPGEQKLCLALPDPIDGFAWNCATTAEALEGKLSTGLVGLPGQREGDALVAAVVPDGSTQVRATSRAGRATSEAVDGNVVIAAVSDAEAISYSHDGQEVSVPVRGTPPELVREP